MIARGLFKKWKQVVFADFDKPMTKEILSDIINQLENSDYT